MLLQILHLALCIAVLTASATVAADDNSQTVSEGSPIDVETTQQPPDNTPQTPVATEAKAVAVDLLPSPAPEMKTDEARKPSNTSDVVREQPNDSPDLYNMVFSHLQNLLKTLTKRKQREEGENVRFEYEVGGIRKNLRQPHVTKFQYEGPRQDYFRHILKAQRKLNDDEQSVCNAIYSCSDCFTARVCRPVKGGTFQHVESIKCPASAPHCDFETGTCRWQSSKECLNPDNFICLSDGHFPDVDCKFYHVCSNLTSERRQCEYEFEYYNAERGHCDAETKYCGFFDCFQQEPGSKTPYTTAPNYFAYCNGNKDPLTIDRCPEGTWLNATTQNCEAMCSEKEGLVQDPADCRKYYKCSKLWYTKTEWSMIKERRDCPSGTGFDPQNFLCVSLEELPSCQPASLQLPTISRPSPDQSVPTHQEQPTPEPPTTDQPSTVAQL